MLLGCLACCGLAWATWASAGPTALPAQRAVDRDGNGAGQMLAFSNSLSEDRQQITVIDPRERVMSVYHIEPKTGEIVLKAVRNITWDMQMTAFNGASPLPQEIRSQLHQR
jgi:hypothetical protein